MIIFSPTLNVGGGEKIASEIAAGIDTSTLICFYGDSNFKNVRFILKKKVPKSKIFKFFDLIYIFLWLTLYFIKQRPNYVLTHIHFVSFIVFFASKFAFQKNIVQDSVIHGRIALERYKNRIYFFLLRVAYRNSRFCICVSNSMVDELQELGINNTRVIFNSVHKGNTTQNVNINDRKLDIKNENHTSFKGIFIGRLEEIKNLPSLLFSLPNNIHIDVYGEGSKERFLKKIVAEKNLNVNFMGFRNNVREVIKNYDFLINTSTSETFSLVLLEAIMESTPIITSNCKFGPMDLLNIDANIYFNIKDFHKVGNFGLVYTLEDEHALKKALNYFATHHDEFYVTDSVRAMYSERYSLKTMVESYKELSL